MAKKKNKLLITLSTLLIAGTSVAGTFAVFNYTDIPSLLISDLHVVVAEEEDQQTKNNLEAAEDQVRKARASKEKMEREVESLRADVSEREATVGERSAQLGEAKSKVHSVPESVATDLRSAQLLTRRKFLERQLAEIKGLENMPGELVGRLEAVDEAVKKLVDARKQYQDLHENVESSLLSYRKALETKSNWKEFWLYLLGLKILWGLFTGYARTFYPYTEEAKLSRDLELLEKNEPELLEKIAEASTRFETEVRSLRSAFKRFEAALKFNTQAQAVFVARTMPLLDRLGEFERGLAEQMRAQEVVHEYIKSFLESKGYVPYYNPTAEPYYSRDVWEQVRRNTIYQALDTAKRQFDELEHSLTVSVVDTVEFSRRFIVSILKEAELKNELTTLFSTTKKKKTTKRS